MPETITIRGRVATTSLRRGETVTVERTEQVDRLIAGGFVEVIGQATPVESEAPAEVSSDEAPAQSEPEAEAPRRPGRKRSGS